MKGEGLLIFTQTWRFYRQIPTRIYQFSKRFLTFLTEVSRVTSFPHFPKKQRQTKGHFVPTGIITGCNDECL